MENKPKKIYKSTTNKKIFGVCGGIAEYFNVDATWVRLAFAFLTLTGTIGLWPYLICALVFPTDAEVLDEQRKEEARENAFRCPNCGNSLGYGADKCQRCGADIPNNNPLN